MPQHWGKTATKQRQRKINNDQNEYTKDIEWIAVEYISRLWQNTDNSRRVKCM